MLPGQGMPPDRCMWVGHAPPPFPFRAMPPGRAMLHGRLLPPGRPMPFEQGMPPGRGIPHGQPMPPGRPMLFGRGMPLGQPVPPGRPMWLEQRMPFQQGSGPAQSRSRGNSQLCLEPPGNVYHHWENRSFRPSSSAHPYRHSQRPPHLHYDHSSNYARLGVSPVGFYRVKLQPCFDEITSVSLLSCISHILENTTIFEPNWSGKTFYFIVDQYNVAQRLLNQDNLIALWSDVKLRIQVDPEIPAFRIDENMRQAITSALRSVLKHNNTKADLTKFYTNRVFTERKKLCSLNVRYVLGHVVDVLSSLAPNLVTLILDDNSLTSLEEAGMVLGKFGRLAVLSLAGNKISSFTELSHLAALSLDALVLRGNNCMSSLSWLDYKNEVHNVLPTIKVLDGQEIISAFFHSDNLELPVWKGACFPENKPLVLLLSGFINRFRTLYDEMGRSNLTEAYHPQAVMSLTCDPEGGSKWRLHNYVRYDRSLLIDANRLLGNSMPILFRGPEAIVAALKTLPDTDHYFEHFTFDLIELNGNTAQIIISGFFKEFNVNKFRVGGKPFKHFHRCLIVVYKCNRVQIVNDSLVIRYPNNSQLSKLALIREDRLQELLVTKFEMMTLNDGQ